MISMQIIMILMNRYLQILVMIILLYHDSNNNMTKPTEAQLITKYDSIKARYVFRYIKKRFDF